MKRTVIAVVICLLLCGAAVCGTLYMRNRTATGQTDSDVSYSDIQTLNELESRKNQITRKLKMLQTASEREKLGKGTVSFVCVGAHKKVYSLVYPELQKRGYSGILVLNDEFFVGDNDCLTKEQFSELVSSGWEIAVEFPSDSAAPLETLRSLINRASELDVNGIQTVLFPSSSYTVRYDDGLSELGLKNVIFHGEGYSRSEVLNLPKPEENSLWTVYAYGYVSGEKGQFLSEMENQGGSIIFEIGFSSDNISSYCTDYGIKNLLTVCSGYDKEKLVFSTLSDARKYFEDLAGGSQQAEIDSLQKQISELETELSEVESRIDGLRKQIGN